MTEATHLHDELLHALQQLIAPTTYQDLRRLNTLAWAVTGLCLRQTVRLAAWAEVTQSQAQTLTSRVQRFSGWLHHPAISPPDWYRPVVQAALSDWPANQPLYLALDTTALRPFVLIRVSLIYRGRAIPLAWRAMRRQSTTVAFQDYRPVLEQARSILSGGQAITLLADRGFAHESLLIFLRELNFHYRLRLPRNTLVHLQDSWIVPVKTLCPPVGQACFQQQIGLFGSAFGPVSLAIARSVEHPNDPWYLASSQPTNATTLQDYALRFEVEESFKDDKSGGFQLQTSRLTTPDALDRLLLCLALATLYLTGLGTAVVRAEQWRQVDHHWGRGLSYLQLGARWRRQQTERNWPAFAPFRLDPAPDPLPLLAPRRLLLAESSEQDLPTAA